MRALGPRCGAAIAAALWLVTASAVAEEEGAAGEADAETSAEGSLSLGGELDPEAGLTGDADVESSADGDGFDETNAGPGPVLEGALRLGLALVVVDFSSVTRENSGAGKRASTDFNLGVRSSSLGAIGGYGLTPELQVGLRLSINLLSGSDENTPPNAAAMSVEIDRSGFDLGVLPFVEYIFAVPSERMRLFALGTVGVRTQQSSQSVGGAESSFSGTVFRFGVGGGLHVFLTDSLSFDPALELAFSTGSLTEETAGAMALDWDFSGLNVSLFAGLSGWLEI